MEQLNYNLLFRWFVGLNADDVVWSATTFSKNRDRLLAGDVAVSFFQGVVEQARQRHLLSSDHFTVDGTLLEAWALQKSFRPKNEDPPVGGSRNTAVDFRGEKRSNDTHASTTDPDARLARKKGKAGGQECTVTFGRDHDMVDPGILAWATLIGTALSVAGVIIAIVQIRRTARAAEAAESAAKGARTALSENVLLSDLTGCIGSIEEIKTHLRSARFESALLRITDTRASLIELRSIVSTPELLATIQHVIAQLALLRDLLEYFNDGRRQGIDRVEAMRALADASDLLTEWLGQAKYLTKERFNDS